MAWLPALTAVTPLDSASGDRSSITARAPRGLKVPVRWNSSSVSRTRVPGPTACARAGSSQRRTGVVTTRSPRRARVARIASRVGCSPISGHGPLAQQRLRLQDLGTVLRAHRELPRLAVPGAVEVDARVAAAAVEHVEGHVEVGRGLVGEQPLLDGVGADAPDRFHAGVLGVAATPHLLDDEVGGEVEEVGLAPARGPRRAHVAVEPEAGAEDGRVAHAARDLEVEAARGGDAADLALGVDAVAVDGSPEMLGVEEAL